MFTERAYPTFEMGLVTLIIKLGYDKRKNGKFLKDLREKNSEIYF